MANKYMLLTCAVFPSIEIAQERLWIFKRSVRKFVEQPEKILRMYGIGRTFPGYITMKLDWQLQYLESNREDFTHVVYTDSWDAFLTTPFVDLIYSYESAGCPPILASGSKDLGNVSDVVSKYPGVFNKKLLNPYPCVGGYIAEIEAILPFFQRMVDSEDRTGDDCFSWYDAIAEGWFKPEIDQGEIFQVGDEGNTVIDGNEVDGSFMYNKRTNTTPCIWHLSGGYTDPIKGKDDRLKPWARALKII